MDIDWKKTEEIDWSDVFETGTIVLVYGKRDCLADRFWKDSYKGYAVGFLQSYSTEEIAVEGIQGTISFLLDDVERVFILKQEKGPVS